MLISKNQLEVPDECPSDCMYESDFARYGQSAMCHMCPIINCSGDEPLVPPEDYRIDWGIEWHEFFRGGCRERVRLILY